MDLRGTFNKMDTIAFIFLLPYERVCSIIRLEYYHFDKLTTDFLASLIKGVTLEDFCKNVSINYSVELYQVIKDYKEIIEELQQLKVLEEIK